MGVFKRSIRRNKQPQTPVGINRSHPIGKDVKGFFTPIGGAFIDLAHMDLASSDSSTRRAGTNGISAEYNNQQTLFPNLADYTLTGAMSIIVICDIDTLSNYGALVSCADTTTTNGYEFRLSSNSSNLGELSFTRCNTTYRAWNSSVTGIVSASTKNNYIGVSCATSSIETQPSVCNVNGQSKSLNTNAGTGTGAQTAASDPLYIGKREDGVTKLDGAINAVILVGRELTFNEHESIRRNPWQLLQPQTKLYTYGAAAPPAGFMFYWAFQRAKMLGAR